MNWKILVIAGLILVSGNLYAVKPDGKMLPFNSEVAGHLSGGGSSGHFKSPYYNNLTDDWVAGKRFRLSPTSVIPIAAMTLVPENPED